MNHVFLLSVPTCYEGLEGYHELAVYMLSGFPIARSLTLTLFGFLQHLFMTVDQFSILLSNIVYIHGEVVETLITLSAMRLIHEM